MATLSFEKRTKAMIALGLAPSVIGLVRQTRWPWLRRSVWTHFAKPYVAWRDYSQMAETRFGARMHCRSSDLVQGRILFFGLWEPTLTFFISRRLKNGDTFVDVGANVGYYTLLAASLVGDNGAVFAVEASPSIFAKLTDNVRANRWSTITPIHAAATAAKGTVPIYRAPNSNIGSTTTLPSRQFVHEADVPADTLSALVGPALFKARLIKIDVEGAEAPVLNTLLDDIGRFGPDTEIVAEITPQEVREHGTTTEAIVARFAAAGFHAYVLDNNYQDEAFLDEGAVTPPRRLREMPEQVPGLVLDLVFSRVDAPTL
jgi:FkbM family methyltransferase